MKAPGCVAILLAPDGHVVASVTDFKRSAPGGFSLYEAQRSRCLTALNYAALDAMCHPDVAKAARGYSASGIIDEMTSKLGYRIETLEIEADDASSSDRSDEAADG